MRDWAHTQMGLSGEFYGIIDEFEYQRNIHGFKAVNFHVHSTTKF